MKKENVYIGPLLRIIAGFVVTVGAFLTYYQSIYWLFLVLFVSVNLFQSGFTGFCMMEKILLALGFSSELRELSKKTRYLKKVMESKEKAIIASRAKSEFLAKMSHEIRTPINGIIGMVELTMETELNEEQKSLLETTSFEANTLINLINDILDFSRIEAGKLELAEVPFKLRESIDSMAVCANVKARQKGLSFTTFVDPGIPESLIGDFGRLRQILANLIGNSMKFTSNGDVSLSITLEQETKGNVTLRYGVKDTGIGIPKEKQRSIFKSFTQADSLITRKYGGTGLGITICKQLVELMNGEMGLESEAGAGSTFWFTTVLKKNALAPCVPSFDVKGLKVLVFEGHRNHRFVICRYLEAHGVRPVCANQASEALDALLNAKATGDSFDLVITELAERDKGGVQLARAIRSSEGIARIPIIALFSNESIGEERLLKELGIQKVLAKPVEMTRLLNAINSALRGDSADVLEKLEATCSEGADAVQETCHGYRILVTEDYPTNQQVALRHLSRAGYNVHLAENGMEAVEMFRNNRYDLVLMDIQMPEMDGFRATKELRRTEAMLGVQRTPIVAMTAFAIAGFQESCLEGGMDDYISKPVRRKQLLEMVEKWTQQETACASARNPKLTRTQNGKTWAPSQESSEEQASGPVSETEALPMNYKQALKEFENDEAFLLEVMEDFLEVTRGQLEAIRRAIKNSDSETLKAEAHSIKGGAANLGAVALSNAATRLEEIGMSGSLGPGMELLNLIETERRKLSDYYQALTA